MTDFPYAQMTDIAAVPEPDLLEVGSTLIKLRKEILAFQERFHSSPKYLLLSQKEYGYLVFDTLARKHNDSCKIMDRILEILSINGKIDVEQIKKIRLPSQAISFSEYPLFFKGIPIVVIPGENIAELLDKPDNILARGSYVVEYSEEKADLLTKDILGKILNFTDSREYKYEPKYIVIFPNDYQILKVHCRNQGAYSCRTAQEIYGYLFGRYISESIDIVVYPQCGEPTVVLDPPRQYIHLIANNPA